MTKASGACLAKDDDAGHRKHLNGAYLVSKGSPDADGRGVLAYASPSYALSSRISAVRSRSTTLLEGRERQSSTTSRSNGTRSAYRHRRRGSRRDHPAGKRLHPSDNDGAIARAEATSPNYVGYSCCPTAGAPRGGAARKRKRGGRVSVECSTQRARWMRYVRLPRASRERSRGSDRRAGMTRIRPDGPGAMRTRTRVRHQRPGWSCQRSYSVQRTRRSCDTFGRSSPTPRATTRRRYVRRLDAMPPPPPPRFACAAVAAAVVVMISSWIWIATAPRSAERLFYTRFLNQHASGGCERARARAADY